VTINLLYN